jgi:hypothetical protein
MSGHVQCSKTFLDSLEEKTNNKKMLEAEDAVATTPRKAGKCC